MQIIQSPHNHQHAYGGLGLAKNLFLAGGISNCPRWQDEVVSMFLSKVDHSEKFNIFNPRRVGDLAKDGSDAIEQIEWEIDYIDQCQYFLFWFPKESVCPITLFELGKITTELWNYEVDHSKSNSLSQNNCLSVGVEPGYTRQLDLEIQLPHICPDIKFDYDLESLVETVITKMKLKRS